jgi:hypothetical protein
LTLRLPGWDAVRALALESWPIEPPLHLWSSYVLMLAIATAVGLAHLARRRPGVGAGMTVVARVVVMMQQGAAHSCTAPCLHQSTYDRVTL